METNGSEARARQDALLAAYSDTGSVFKAAEKSGVQYKWHSRWMKADPAYAERFAGVQADRLAKGLKNRGGKGRPGPDESERQQQFREEFLKTGSARDAARAIGMDPARHYDWLHENPEYAERFNAVKAEAVRLGLGGSRRKGRKFGPLRSGKRVEQTRDRKVQFIEALAKTGLVTHAAQEVGFEVSMVYAWMQADPEFAAKVDVTRTAAADRAREISYQRRSEANKAARARLTPEQRQARSDAMSAAWTPEMRAAAAERIGERFGTPEAEAKRRESMKKAWKDPAMKARRSAQSKAMWADPEKRARLMAVQQSPEMRRGRSERMKARWAAMTQEERDAKIRQLTEASITGGTRLERAIRNPLNERDLTYQVQRMFGACSADVYFPHLHLDVEADGDWCHDPERDARHDAVMAAHGVTVLRLSEAELDAGDLSRLWQALGITSS